MTKLVYGVGINDGKYPANVNGRPTKVWNIWHKLLGRCYSLKTQKTHPTYIGCQVSENFKNFTYFYEWCQTQIGFTQEDFQLDKDLVFKGNKIYSEDTCLFLPSELNKLLPSCRAARGAFPIGVSARNNKFSATCRRGAITQHIGLFDTPKEAHNAYKQAKEAYIKSQAEKWKAHIDPRAFAALMAYEVSISD